MASASASLLGVGPGGRLAVLPRQSLDQRGLTRCPRSSPTPAGYDSVPDVAVAPQIDVPADVTVVGHVIAGEPQRRDDARASRQRRVAVAGDQGAEDLATVSFAVRGSHTMRRGSGPSSVPRPLSLAGPERDQGLELVPFRVGDRLTDPLTGICVTARPACPSFARSPRRDRPTAATCIVPRCKLQPVACCSPNRGFGGPSRAHLASCLSDVA